MLLPSPFTCDPAQPRLQTALFASPPASPPQLSTQNAIGNIFNTCRSLHSLLAAAPMPLSVNTDNSDYVFTDPITPPTSSHAQLPTPPLAHAVAPQPLKLRLRPRKADSSVLGVAPVIKKRIAKRTPVAPRGVNKRRRATDDDMGREAGHDGNDSDVESDLDISNNVEEAAEDPMQSLSTPKRARIAPEVIPLGLERGDYHTLHLVEKEEEQPSSHMDDEDVEEERDGEMWTTEEDRMLVELVLEKLKLTKSDWQDCARSLGKDKSSLGRRWKSLMINGDVGLKRSSRRSKIHGTWR